MSLKRQVRKDGRKMSKMLARMEADHASGLVSDEEFNQWLSEFNSALDEYLTVLGEVESS